MKPIFSLIVVVAFAFSARAELTIISTEHRETADFKRFSEYFTGKENQGRYAIYRSAPEERTGFYVSLEAESKASLDSVSKIRLHFVRPNTQEVETRDFAAGEIRRKRLLVGLTEAEWQASNARPVAWKVELVDTSGKTLDSAQSFLWSE